MILCDVEPLLQVYVKPAGPLSKTLPPGQNDKGPFAIIVSEGAGLTITLTPEETAVQPVLFVTVTT